MLHTLRHRYGWGAVILHHSSTCGRDKRSTRVPFDDSLRLHFCRAFVAVISHLAHWTRIRTDVGDHPLSDLPVPVSLYLAVHDT